MALSLDQALDQLSGLEAAYQVSRNPIDVWRAYQICRRSGIPLPSWILGYFDASASSICNLVDPEEARHRLPQQARQIGLALGFDIRRGQANLFEQAKRRDRNQRICQAIEAALITHRGKLYFAYGDVSKKFDLSPSTICRIWLASRAGQR
jgi:hypothetical protein